ncbi:MAG: HDOD domain-containing protein [Pirellulales bacterium]
MTTNSHPLEQLAAQAGSLYSLPAVAMEVIRLTDHPRVDVQALKLCIERDPALTSKVLRVVNSSLFGLSSEVSNLNQALALLGTKPLKLLVLGFSLPDGLFKQASEDVLRHYWRHTLTKAVAAREIGQRIYHSFSDEVFIAGLLEDLGLLVLVQQLGEPYVDFLRKVWNEGASLPELEHSSLGFEHRELTARLLAQWGLPQVLIDAVARPRNVRALSTMAPQNASLPQILHLADLLAMYLNSEQTEYLEQLLVAAHAYRKTTRGQITLLLDAVQPKVEQLAEVLRIELPGGIDYHAIIAAAHQQLAAVATDSVPEVVQYLRTHGSRKQEAVDPEQAVWQEARRLSESLSALAQRVPAKRPADTSDRSGEPSEQESQLHGDKLNAPLREQSAVAVAPSDSVTVHGALGLRDTVERLQSIGDAVIQVEADPYQSLDANLASIVDECRRQRRPLSLVLWEVEFTDLASRRQGHGRLVRLGRWIKQACTEMDHPGGQFLRITPTRAAWVLPDADRSAAVSLVRAILHEARAMSPETAPQCEKSLGRGTFSAGVSTVAIPHKSFEARQLIEAADRCLYGAASFGGDSVKSIDVF